MNQGNFCYRILLLHIHADIKGSVVFLEDGLEDKMCVLVLASGSKTLSLALSWASEVCPWPRILGSRTRRGQRIGNTYNDWRLQFLVQIGNFLAQKELPNVNILLFLHKTSSFTDL